MTFDDFYNEWNGKSVDFDGVYPNQCMDLMHQYVYECLGITDKNILAAPSAAQAYTNFNAPQYFDKIDNTPNGVPQKGDILFFGTTIGPYGHVCIFRDGDSNQFNSFDANWPIGSLPHIQNHNYNGVLGWLHPKAQVDTVAVSKTDFENLVNKSTLYDQFVAKGYKSVTDVNRAVDSLSADLEARTNDYSESQATIYNLRGQVDDLTKKLTDCQNSLPSGGITPSHTEFRIFGRRVWLLNE